ncbi:MAG: hypothetical protein PF693_01855, partial [Spirochaetia bacterium]|nr:hypothetical protein [Spirochaetia bacterium]
QLGLRITNSIFGYDLGISYQYTFLRESDQKIPNSLERIHLFGLETAFVIAAFNIRAESAYYMTSDFSGKNPLVHNNKLQYLFGFDRDLMIHNISINIQGMGEFKLGTEGITGISDIDYESNDAYSSHLLTAGLKDSFLNEKITTELNGTYSMEDGDFMVIPELRLNLIEDTWLNMKYTFFYGDSDTFFGQFEDNDFLEIRMEYSF